MIIIEEEYSKEKLFKIKLVFCAIYGFLITVLSKTLIYFLSLESVKTFINSVILIFNLDILFFDFLDYTKPFLHLERLAFLLQWSWLLPYVFFAFIIGFIHGHIFNRRLYFNFIVYTSLFAYVFMLLTYSVPYGIFPALLYFVDFVKKFYMEPIFIIPLSVVFLFLGTEITEIWIVNNRRKKYY